MLKSAITTLGIAAVALGSAGVAEARTQIRIVGSSTVYPFTTAVAESFKRSNPQFPAPIVESTGTGAGIKLFCAGVGQQYPDFANASRRIKASEAKTCADNGVTGILELQIGLDGLVFAQARGGSFPGLTEVDVYKALAANPFGKPNTAKTWKDVNPALPALPEPPLNRSKMVFRFCVLGTVAAGGASAAGGWAAAAGQKKGRVRLGTRPVIGRKRPEGRSHLRD